MFYAYISQRFVGGSVLWFALLISLKTRFRLSVAGLHTDWGAFGGGGTGWCFFKRLKVFLSAKNNSCIHRKPQKEQKVLLNLHQIFEAA